jgi:hypothetical protein
MPNGIYSKAPVNALYVGQLGLPQLGGHLVDVVSLMPRKWQFAGFSMPSGLVPVCG